MANVTIQVEKNRVLKAIHIAKECGYKVTASRRLHSVFASEGAYLYGGVVRSEKLKLWGRHEEPEVFDAVSFCRQFGVPAFNGDTVPAAFSKIANKAMARVADRVTRETQEALADRASEREALEGSQGELFAA